MSKLIHALQRLYFFPGQQVPNPDPDGSLADRPHELLSPDGMVRAMVICFDRPADWELVAGLYQGMQSDLDLPAPAVSVLARGGYQVWLSLTNAVPLAEASAFLAALRHRYLVDLPPGQLHCVPAAGQGGIDLVPALDAASGKWSAFIDPSMGAMFMAEPGLEMAPNMDRQAEMLSRLESIGSQAFQQALASLQAETGPAGGMEQGVPAGPKGAAETSVPSARVSLGSHFTDPKAFLLAVMNDTSASTEQRIEAAKALLPYFNGPGAA